MLRVIFQGAVQELDRPSSFFTQRTSSSKARYSLEVSQFMSTTETGKKVDSHASKLEMFAHVMGRFVPDAITASVILLVILTGMALGLGNR
jgi:hypothetical protein